jgi:predicted DNA-binding transcriptional regulator AlpA
VIQHHLKLLTLPQVMERVALRKTAIYCRIKLNEFPHPVSIGMRNAKRDTVRWREDDIDRWLLARNQGTSQLLACSAHI